MPRSRELKNRTPASAIGIPMMPPMMDKQAPLRAKGASVPAAVLLIAAALNADSTLLHCDRHYLTIGKYSDLKQQCVGDLYKIK
jgi:hypothetical protein